MPLAAAQLLAIRRSLSGYTGQVAGRLIEDLVGGLKTAVESLIQPGTEWRAGRAVEVGLNPATARTQIAALTRAHGVEGILDSERVDFALTVAREVAQGAGTFAKEAADPDVVDAFPAWELIRVYERAVPRGRRRGPNGALVADPGQDWESRWAAAGGALTDGRMIALKSAAVWQQLGDGAGGYSDTLGNPFPPFAFNSGYEVNNVSRAECQDLGLLAPGAAVAPHPFDLARLFAPLGAAA